MTARVRRTDLGLADARRHSASAGAELRATRLAAGISQATAARAAGMSEGQWGRLERNELARPDLVQLCCAGRALGLEGSYRYFPAGDAVRDSAQLSLAARFEAVLRPPLRMRREVLLPGRDTMRAWDGMVHGDGAPFVVECESHAGDAQALERRLRIKLGDDDRMGVLILVLARSVHHRNLLREHREVFRDLLPLDAPAILRAVRAGRRPSASGILML
jgi:transcriptional regulator with XRE-family HTH domain